MTYITEVVRPAKMQAWIAANAPGSLKNTARESWRAYLLANSGSGQSLGDLERSFLNGQAVGPGTDHDRWTSKESATSGNTGREKVRNKYQ